MKGGSQYGVLSRLLHRVVLGSSLVRIVTSDLNELVNVVKGRRDSGRPVFICGLARSGTSVLLQILAGTGAFASLLYRDMPFVLAPGVWARVIKATGEVESVIQERAHGDGLLMSLDIPEALEEIFWNTHLRYVLEADRLDCAQPDENVLRRFAGYRADVVNVRTRQAGKTAVSLRYLSKNNNNLLRIKSLLSISDATVLVPFRDPFDTAYSLHQQHLRFCELQSSDRFIREYMGYLMHFEFGLGHRPLAPAKESMVLRTTPDDPEYWLDYWCGVHEYLLSLPAGKIIFHDHDGMLRNPEKVLRRLFDRVGLSGIGVLPLALVDTRPRTAGMAYSRTLVDRATVIAERLRHLANSIGAVGE